MNSKYFLIN